MLHRILETATRYRVRRAGFRSEWVDTPHGQHHLLTADGMGDGPPVVMLHGLSSQGLHFHRIALGLISQARQLLLPDFLGHGDSARPEGLDTGTALQAMCQLLDRVGGEPFVVYGNSMGAWAGLKYAAQRPERVAGLLVTAPAGGRLDEAFREEIRELFRVESLDDARAIIDRAFASPPFPRWALSRLVHHQMTRPEVRTLLETIDPEHDLTPDELGRLGMPLRVLWGEADRMLHPTQREWFAAHLPAHGRLETRAGWGHSAYLDRTRELIDALQEFLEEVSGPV